MSYILIISEKPSAAKKIAQSLAEGEMKELGSGGAVFYKFKRGGKEIVVAPAAGHLFVLAEKKTGIEWTYPVFDIEWVPIFKANKNNTWSQKYFENFQSVAKDASAIISATDYDIEGSVIAFNIIKFICKKTDGKRMKFSTLTKSDLVEAYENASPHLDFPQIEAGLTRHYLDYFWGINTSRALTLALRSAGGYQTLSTGRVQGPTLEILEKRQREIQDFKPTPFWEIELQLEKFTASHITDKFWKKEEVDSIFKKVNGTKKATVIEVDKRETKLNPPFPFDLTTLQREAYNIFSFSPKQTLDIAQALYEQGAISYPRTSSQKLPAKIGYMEIIKTLSKKIQYSVLCEKLLEKKNPKPNEGPKEDPAHPSIFPTQDIPNMKALTPQQAKLYDLIVKRFLSVFADPAIRESVTVKLDVKRDDADRKSASIIGEIFVSNGIRTIQANWLDFYKPYSKLKEQILPPLKKGEQLEIKKVEILEKETQPPNRFTQGSILKELEDLGLGTKSTRALILQTLYDRGYIRDKTIEVTKLGESVIKSLEKYCPEIVSVELTKDFESGMEAIVEEKKKREDIVNSAEEMLKKILKSFKQNERKIGDDLIGGIREVMKEASTVGKCKCGNDLVIRMSKNKKRFIGCMGYPNCTQTFSLPHQGNITIISQLCTKCGLKIVSVKAYKKRPWKLCVRDGFVMGKKKLEEEKEENKETKEDDVADSNKIPIENKPGNIIIKAEKKPKEKTAPGKQKSNTQNIIKKNPKENPVR